MGRVARARAEVEEERLGIVDVAQVAQVFDGVVDEVLGEVVPLGDGPRWLDRVVVAVERGHELVRLATVEAVPAVEPAPERPAAAVGGHVRLVVGREVPFADGVRRVPGGPQDLRQEPVLGRDLARVARIGHGEVGDAAHAVRVVIAAGEQARTRRRAERSGVEVGEPHPRRRQCVDVRRLDDRSVAPELGEADVVEHEVDHVGCALRCLGTVRPRRGRVAPVPSDHSGELVVHAHGPLLAPRCGTLIRRRTRSAYSHLSARIKTEAGGGGTVTP